MGNTVSNYLQFLKKKEFAQIESGFDVSHDELHESLFGFQKAVLKWALKRGRAALFLDTGLGKTRTQVEWAKHIQHRANGSIMILAPLCVTDQTVREAQAIGVEVKYVREQPQETEGIFITNYEMAQKMDLSVFTGIVLDESSIIKHKDSKTRNALIAQCRDVPYKLSCTATPSPNDYMELGNQAEFCGVMGMSEMLAMFFTHDSGQTSKWRLKGHGERKFWEWLSTWAVMMKKPSDLGFDNTGYDLPGLNIHEVQVKTGLTLEDGKTEAATLSERNQARKLTLSHRVAEVAKMVNASEENWIVWCFLNDESKMLTESIEGAVEVKGSDPIHKKEANITAFSQGQARVIVTKPSITGFGLNWQHCRNMAFVGLNDSYEQLYQAIRRCYRFGQTKEVNAYLISSDLEGAVLENIKRKEAQAEAMMANLVEYMAELTKRNVVQLNLEKTEYEPESEIEIPLFLGA